MFHLQGTMACVGCCARLRAAMMIDVFNHFMPQAYLERLGTLIPGHPVLTAFPRIKPLWDVDARRALLDEFPGTQHVLSLANPPPELIGPPVWVHPMRTAQFSDYASEKESQNEIWFSFGWPYETTACMTRLIYSGIFDELPTLKIISHHMGGMIPYFAGKIKLGFKQIFFGTPDVNPVAQECGLKRPPLDYFKMLHADTALGEDAPTRCGHAFFGTGHCLFATDA